jgi:acetate kinase
MEAVFERVPISAKTRLWYASATCEGLGWLGITIDPRANESGSRCVSPANASPSVWVIPTDEERVIAEHTLAVIRAART